LGGVGCAQLAQAKEEGDHAKLANVKADLAGADCPGWPCHSAQPLAAIADGPTR
jgi:hypothetical protein